MKRKKLLPQQRYVLIAILLFLLLQALLAPFLWNPLIYIDIAVLLLLLGLFALVARRQELPTYSYFAVFLPIVTHSIGNMGMYPHFLFGIGFDKYIHFSAGIGLFLVFYALLKDFPRGERCLIAFLAVMGCGAINEVSEFIGQHYLGIEWGGFFTFGDGLPATGSPLQVYDTYFDMLFNAAGSLITFIGIMLHSLFAREKKKRAR